MESKYKNNPDSPTFTDSTGRVIPKITHMENNIRLWDAAFEFWKNRGNPLNDLDIPMPRKHP